MMAPLVLSKVWALLWAAEDVDTGEVAGASVLRVPPEFCFLLEDTR